MVSRAEKPWSGPATQVGADTVITFDASNKIILSSFTVGNLNADDFIF